MIIERFGKLSRESSGLSSGSGKRVEWNCDCGRKTTLEYRAVVRGNTSSCGRCNEVSAEEMSTRKFGRLRMEFPECVTPGSGRKVSWLCDCGRKKDIIITCVFRGDCVTCNQCNNISAHDMSIEKFGRLRMETPHEISPGSNKTVSWLCDCGRKSVSKICWVIGGKIRSCGHCNDVPASEMSNRKFGKLRQKFPSDVASSSMKECLWTCDCGRDASLVIQNVVLGGKSSCGKCDRVINKAKEPIADNNPVPVRVIDSVPPPDTSCVLCGRASACLCVRDRISTVHEELIDYIRGLEVQANLGHMFSDLKYDIFVPSRNLFIEYNRLRWHLFPDAKKEDVEKYNRAVSSGFDYLLFFEDEWLFGKHKIEALLRNRLGVNRPRNLRPKSCEIKLIPSAEADVFLESNHYIGKCRASINYGIFYEDKLIGCVSFKHPTRQSSHDWELVRMASYPEFRVHGIWSKVLRRFIREHAPTSIVSFSDNRLFQGGVYEKLGFSFDGVVSPDYYWCKQDRRYHKSGLRKKGDERTSGLTEYQLREAQGYHRIWDLGKKRWILKCASGQATFYSEIP